MLTSGRLRYCCLIGAMALATPVVAQPPAAPVYGLAELVALAMQHHGDVAQGIWKVRGAEAVQRQARAARIVPRLRLNSENGWVPDARGTVLDAPHDSAGYLARLGPFTRNTLEFAQPLYTFGQLGSLNRAADGGLAAERAALEQTRAEVRLEVKRLYYGLLLAQDMSQLVARLATRLSTEQERLADRETLSLANGYKLKLALIDLATRQREADDKVALARGALAWRAGLDTTALAAVADTGLAPVATPLPALDELQRWAAGNRPEWRRLAAGLAARQAQYEAARSARLPQLFLAGGLRYARAPGRTDQHNPFVKDEFNYDSAGLYVGLKQSFEWGLLGAEVDKARAAYEELRARQVDGEHALRLDVQRAWTEYQRADRDRQSADEARHLARQWLQEAQNEYDLDPDTLKDLITAFETWAKLEQAWREAVYRQNVRWAELERCTGGMPEERQ
jgi:outer membrane protein TolC